MNLAEFLKQEKEDSNLFWRLSSGQHQNLLEEALERIKELENGGAVSSGAANVSLLSSDEIRKRLEAIRNDAEKTAAWHQLNGNNQFAEGVDWVIDSINGLLFQIKAG